MKYSIELSHETQKYRIEYIYHYTHPARMQVHVIRPWYARDVLIYEVIRPFTDEREVFDEYKSLVDAFPNHKLFKA